LLGYVGFQILWLPTSLLEISSWESKLLALGNFEASSVSRIPYPVSRIPVEFTAFYQEKVAAGGTHKKKNHLKKST